MYRIIVLGLVMALAGCAHQDLKAPCANFGKHCHAVPINSWNYLE